MDVVYGGGGDICLYIHMYVSTVCTSEAVKVTSSLSSASEQGNWFGNRTLNSPHCDVSFIY